MKDFPFFNASKITEYQQELHDLIVKCFDPKPGEFHLHKISPNQISVSLNFTKGEPDPNDRDGIELFNRTSKHFNISA